LHRPRGYPTIHTSNGAQWECENGNNRKRHNDLDFLGHSQYDVRADNDRGSRCPQRDSTLVGVLRTQRRERALRKGRPIMNRNDNLWAWGVGLFIGLIALICVLCPTKHKELSDYQKFEIIERNKHSKLDAWLEGR